MLFGPANGLLTTSGISVLNMVLGAPILSFSSIMAKLQLELQTELTWLRFPATIWVRVLLPDPVFPKRRIPYSVIGYVSSCSMPLSNISNRPSLGCGSGPGVVSPGGGKYKQLSPKHSSSSVHSLLRSNSNQSYGRREPYFTEET